MKHIAITLAALTLLSGCQSLGRSAGLPEPTVGASVQRLSIRVAPQDDIHEGSAVYPLGFGSGLDFVGVQAGELTFLGITDRGPNLDGPAVGNLTSKLFPAPGFHPSLVEVKVKDGVARVTKVVTLKVAGKPITGLPRPASSLGFSQEKALSMTLADLGSDPAGLDTETVRLDPSDPRFVWISDEYGPFIVRADRETGEIVRTLAPGSGLPELLAKRQPNRGMEGLAVTPKGLLVGALQSILDVDGQVKKSPAGFTRLVVIDPATGRSSQFAYPIDVAAYKKTADAKIGDLVAVGETEFLVIEQGTEKSGAARNLVYRINLAGASDLTGKQLADGRALELGTAADLTAAGVVPAQKTLVMDLRASWAWKADKAEGLAVLDARRFAVISDNDFGLATEVANPAAGADGKLVTDPTAYALTEGRLALGGQPTEATLKAGDNGQPTAFWIFTVLDKLY